MIEESESDGIVTLRLAHGKASALDLDLTDGLAADLETLARRGTRGVVLTGTGGIFSAGVDLFKLVSGGTEYAAHFLPSLEYMFETLFMFPGPVVAAVNGHAIAGGCILACACDRRLMATGAARIGVPELRVGVPFPPLVVEILRASVPAPHFNELLYVGRTYEPADALARGMIDELVAPDELRARAQAVAADLAAAPAASFTLTKRAMRMPYLERARRTADADAGALLAAWTSSETLAAIRSYLEKTLPRSKSAAH
ncbi:MAG TPA: enoyl-CoA hydratase/isomerase family protein [Vicinamibacterales bacterium]